MKSTKWKFSYIVEVDIEGPISWKMLPPVRVEDDRDEEDDEGEN